MSAAEARQELAEFLKSRRARLTPADVALPQGRNRRTIGLRREEVATLAGVGLAWYTRFEQGKDIKVSSAFLDNLARALQLNEAERAHLFALAHHRPPAISEASHGRIEMPALQAILDAIDAPAYARNTRFDVLAWNHANTRMFGNFAAIPPDERNVVRLMFTRAYHRRAMPEWSSDARALLAKFRMNLGLAADRRGFLALIADLSRVSAEFRAMWATQDVSDLGEGVTRFSSPRLGECRFQHQILMPEAMPDARIVIFLEI